MNEIEKVSHSKNIIIIAQVNDEFEATKRKSYTWDQKQFITTGESPSELPVFQQALKTSKCSNCSVHLSLR